jgi:sRNA-binding carbon storage regulator CsrA
MSASLSSRLQHVIGIAWFAAKIRQGGAWMLVVKRSKNEDLFVFGEVGNPILRVRFLQRTEAGLASIRFQWNKHAKAQVIREEPRRSFWMQRKRAKGRRTVLGLKDRIEIHVAGNRVSVSINRLTGKVKAQIGIEAPASCKILRGELAR